jgi:aspartyl-tRNA(Asn)/glutamyl-tRNA(Gln) amidotransferase subunit C
MENPTTVSDAEVEKIARLSRLTLSPEQIKGCATQLTCILRYADRLRDVDVKDIEPLPHIGETVNRLDDDQPGAVLDHSALMRMAPDTHGPFLKVPKVLGDEGGA